jgi:hypothetical protein
LTELGSLYIIQNGVYLYPFYHQLVNKPISHCKGSEKEGEVTMSSEIEQQRDVLSSERPKKRPKLGSPKPSQ